MQRLYIPQMELDLTSFYVQGTEEKRYADNNHATTEEVTSIDDFISKVQEDEKKGGLLDSNVAGHYKTKLNALKFSDVFGDNEYT